MSQAPLASLKKFELDTAARTWLHAFGVTEAGIKYIDRALKSPPAVALGQSERACVLRLPNPTTGHIIETKGEQEFAFVDSQFLCDDTRAVLGRPEPINITTEGPSGRQSTHAKQFPFLLIRSDFVGFVVCEEEARLQRLVDQGDVNWTKNENGAWIYSPAVQAAGRLGLQFKVFLSSGANLVKLANYQALQDYLDERTPPVTDAEANQLRDAFGEDPQISLEELGTRGISADLALRAIAQGQLPCDLEFSRLDQRSEFLLFREPQQRDAYVSLSFTASRRASGIEAYEIKSGTKVIWESVAFRVVTTAGDKVLVTKEQDGSIHSWSIADLDRLEDSGAIEISCPEATPSPLDVGLELFAEASQRSKEAALRRLKEVESYLNHQPVRSGRSARSLAYWVADYRAAQAAYGLGIVGLLNGKPGRYEPRFPQQTYELFDQVRKQHWPGGIDRTFMAFYGRFAAACDADGLAYPCEKTARKWVQRATTQEDRTRNQRGAGEAYGLEPFHLTLKYTLPRHGGYPWHIVHVDHTKVDLRIRLPNGRHRTRRAWLTLAVDAYTRRVLATLLTWDPPSYRTCMLITRLLIKRWGRVPKHLVIDGGPEFRSTYFEVLLAVLGVTKKTRPRKKPRHGSVIERLFGIADKQFWHNLLGNTQSTKRNVRTVTPDVDPEKQSVWTLPALQIAADSFFYVEYDRNEHGGIGMAPCEAYAQGIAEWGNREWTHFTFNETLEILTMPAPKKNTAMVVPGRGVKVNYRYFWCDAFHDGKVERTRVEVRYCPFDGSRAWALVNGKWLRLICSDAHLYAGLSERAVSILTGELTDRARREGQRRKDTAISVARLLAKASHSEAFLAQVAVDADQSAVLRHIFGSDSLTGSCAIWQGLPKAAVPTPVPAAVPGPNATPTQGLRDPLEAFTFELVNELE